MPPSFVVTWDSCPAGACQPLRELGLCRYPGELTLVALVRRALFTQLSLPA